MRMQGWASVVWSTSAWCEGRPGSRPSWGLGPTFCKPGSSQAVPPFHPSLSSCRLSSHLFLIIPHLVRTQVPPWCLGMPQIPFPPLLYYRLLQAPVIRESPNQTLDINPSTLFYVFFLPKSVFNSSTSFYSFLKLPPVQDWRVGVFIQHSLNKYLLSAYSVIQGSSQVIWSWFRALGCKL